MRLLRSPGAKQHSKKHAFCAPRAQNSVSAPPQARILRSSSTKQRPARTPPAHFAPCGRETAHRTQASQTLPPRTAANRRRRLSRPQTRNNFDRKSPRHARGDLHFSLCACRSRPAGGKARSGVQFYRRDGFAISPIISKAGILFERIPAFETSVDEPLRP